MLQHQQQRAQEESDFKKFSDLVLKNYKLFIAFIIIAFGIAFLINRFSIPVYKISSSILIKESNPQQAGGDVNDFLNSNLLGKDQKFQNELWVIKSTPVIEQTVRNLNLSISYYNKEAFKYQDAYQYIPFKVFLVPNHPQPLNIIFKITFLTESLFQLEADGKKVYFYDFDNEIFTHQKGNWNLVKNAGFGELIETGDAAFIIERDTSWGVPVKKFGTYAFNFSTISSLSEEIKGSL